MRRRKAKGLELEVFPSDPPPLPPSMLQPVKICFETGDAVPVRLRPVDESEDHW